MKTIMDDYDTFARFKIQNPSTEGMVKWFFDCIVILNARVRFLNDRVEALEGKSVRQHGSDDEQTFLPCSYCGKPIRGNVTFLHGEQACDECCKELGEILDQRQSGQGQLFL